MISVLNHSLEFESHALTRLRVGQVVIPVSKQKQIHMGEAALPVIGDGATRTAVHARVLDLGAKLIRGAGSQGRQPKPALPIPGGVRHDARSPRTTLSLHSSALKKISENPRIRAILRPRC